MAITSKRTYTSPEAKDILKHNAQQSHRLTENSSDIMLLLDANGMITYISPSIIPLLGYAPEEIVGSHARVLVHPDDLATLQQMLAAIEEIPGRSLSAEYRLCCKDGSWRWFEGSATNLLQVPEMGAIIGYFREITKQKLAPLQWSEMHVSDHFVQFYETDDFLLDSLSEFIATGLETGDACIVIATSAHRQGLEERLQAEGLDLAQIHGQYIPLDAGETLAQFMVDGEGPDPDRFTQVIGNLIMQASKGQRRVRALGEMVALLWAEGNRLAAIRLEELWNELQNKIAPFSLFCAYSMHNFAGEVYGDQFSEICLRHSHVIPDESYIALASPDERLLAISLLPQKANSLQAEVAQRKRLEAKFRYLFDSNLIGVFISDFAGTFLEANDAFLDLLGYTREELLAGTIKRDNITPPEFLYLSQDALKSLQESGSSGTYEKEYLHKSGKRIPVLIAVTRIEQTETCIGFVLDISERKELDKRKDEFISMASHELKTPVTSLKGFLGLLQRLLATRGEEKALHYLARMDTQVNKLTKLINDLLDLSKIQTGKLSYREERFDIDALVQEVIENVQETTQTHHLQLKGQTRTEMFGDRDRIGQVLINLLNNAIKYSPRADTVLVCLAKDQNNIIVSVQDFGIGIAEEHQHKIFERFYQVTDPEEKTYPGLGIGLNISCEIVKRHGGWMWVESQKGKGATFHFTLPLVQQDMRQAPCTSEQG